MKKNNNIRKVMAITGIRSDYDLIYPILDAIRKDPSLELQLVVSGAHFSKFHNKSVNYIKKDKFKIVGQIDNFIEEKTDVTRAKGTGILITKLPQIVKRNKPDFLLVAGDREEPLAGAIVGNYLKIPVVHLFGGDPVYGNADDPVRHALSKLAHIHCTILEEHRDRLIKMGEEPFRTFYVGNPSLDKVRSIPKSSRKQLSERLAFDLHDKKEPFIIVLQHPLSSELKDTKKHIKATMEAVRKVGIRAVVIYPNTDPGSDIIVKYIEQYKKLPQIKVFRTLGRTEFFNLMRHASCILGNSSSGVLEAPYFMLPAINVGNRQKGRINAGNVIFIKNEEKIIETTLKKVVYDKKYRRSVLEKTEKKFYGDGRTGPRITRILSRIKIDSRLLIKKNTY